MSGASIGNVTLTANSLAFGRVQFEASGSQSTFVLPYRVDPPLYPSVKVSVRGLDSESDPSPTEDYLWTLEDVGGVFTYITLGIPPAAGSGVIVTFAYVQANDMISG